MLTRILNRFIANLKGYEYKIDQRIPATYLFHYCLWRLTMLLNGALSNIPNRGQFFLSPSAKVRMKTKIKLGRAVTIDYGCRIDALSQIGIVLGNNVTVGRKTIIECTGNLQSLGLGMVAGNNVGLGTDSFYGCAGGIYIGDNTIIGNYVSFHSENHVFEAWDVPIKMQGVVRKGIRLGKNCWVGAKSTILDGAVVEDNCVIAAGSVVTAGLYTSGGIYGGVPAKLIKRRTPFQSPISLGHVEV